MAPSQQRLNFGIWLRKKRNFYVFSIATVGVGAWLILVWNFGHLGGPLWITFLALDAFLASLLWAFGMWHLFVLPLVKRLSGTTDAT